MDWVKLTTNYYLDAAIMRAGEAAEVLFTRALAYCGDQENGGLVPREVLPRLVPSKGPARAAALVREGLWDVDPAGWRFARWAKHQADRSQLESRREAGRRRQQKHRNRENKPGDGVRDGVRDGVTDASVTGGEVEGEVDAAAAAARDASPNPLPEPVAILRAALDAHRLEVRWDRLTVAELDEIEALVAEHGDQRLIQSAKRAWRPDHPAVFASAWLPGWRALGTPLRLVDSPACPLPGHTGTTRHCAQCASEQKAAR